MKAFLLAAGKGRRLQPLTDSIPKCLIKIGDDTLLGIWLKLLKKNNVDSVLINTHHLVEKLENYVKNNPLPGLNIHLFFEHKLLGSAKTIAVNRDFVRNERYFYIIYSDNLTNINLADFSQFHLKKRSHFTVGLFETKNPTQCGIVKCNKHHKIIEFEEKPVKPKSSLATGGIYIADSSIFDIIPDKPYADFGYDVLPKMVNKMYGYPIKEFFLDIGTQERLSIARKEWSLRCKDDN